MNILFLIGRILLGGFFIYSGFNHFSYMKNMVEYTKSKKIPAPHLAVAVSGLMILIGGLFVLFAFHFHTGLALIAIFLILVTPMMHQFWKEKDHMRMIDQTSFLKNVAILGAVLILMVR